MIQLIVYMHEDVVVWRMIKMRPAHEWRALGPTYWERRGDVYLEETPTSDREMISAALRAIMDRLGER